MLTFDIILNSLSLLWIAAAFWLFVKWLTQTHYLRNAFPDAPPLKHKLEFPDILIIIVIFILPAGLLHSWTENLELDKWGEKNVSSLILIAAQMLTIIVVVFFARFRFARGLAGFGFHRPHPGFFLKTFFLYALTVFGLTYLTLFLTIQISSLFGHDIVQIHPFLQLLRENPPMFTKVLLFINPVLFAPFAEEMFFRGILLNFLVRTLTKYDALPRQLSPRYDASGNTPSSLTRWLAVFATSVLFAVSHGSWQHWPALFILSSGLGYTYLRYGNILLPIALHALFNALPVILTLLKFTTE